MWMLLYPQNNEKGKGRIYIHLIASFMSITSTTSLSPLFVTANLESVVRQKYREFFFQLKSFICLMGAILT